MDKDDYRVIANINEKHYERIRDKFIEHDRELKSHRKMIFAMYLIIVLMLALIGICFVEVERTKAATIDMRDEPVGGFSYMMDCLERNDIPEDYKKILRMWHPAYEITQDEYDILVRIVEAEATGGNHEQKMNVASCVLARVEAPQWPDNIKDVVFQKQQFTPIWDGRYYTVKIQESTKKAVDEVLKFGKTHDCLWFCSDDSYNKKNEKGEYCSYHRLNHTWVFFDEEHHYFYD